MSESSLHLSILVVEDDQDNLKLMLESLPKSLDGCQLHYHGSTDIEGIAEKLKWLRYDMVLTDIYRDRKDKRNKSDPADAKADEIVCAIRDCRFCPVVAFTDGSFPTTLTDQQGPFFILADKSKGDGPIVEAMRSLLATGIPQIARRLHDELDSAAGPQYLWGFLMDNWDKFDTCSRELLDRIIRRRASIQIGRLKPMSSDPEEIQHASPAEYYIVPPISRDYRLGHILRRKSDGKFSVVLTPHCYLETQPGNSKPRAEQVQIVGTETFDKVIKLNHSGSSPWKTDQQKNLEKLRRFIQSPAQIGKPSGRYWFLPAFHQIPDLYCDFLQVSNVDYALLDTEFEALATLDTPYAEAFQSCFSRFYSPVGLPAPEPEAFRHLIKSD